jgi:hypothetical protein
MEINNNGNAISDASIDINNNNNVIYWYINWN